MSKIWWELLAGGLFFVAFFVILFVIAPPLDDPRDLRY